jgi:hypothetical protein
MYIVFLAFALFIVYALWIEIPKYWQIKKGKKVKASIKSIQIKDKNYLIPPKIGIPLKLIALLFGEKLFLGYDGFIPYEFEYEFLYNGKKISRTEIINSRKTLKELRLKPGNKIVVNVFKQKKKLKTKMQISDSRPTLFKLLLAFILLIIFLLLAYMDWSFS